MTRWKFTHEIIKLHTACAAVNELDDYRRNAMHNATVAKEKRRPESYNEAIEMAIAAAPADEDIKLLYREACWYTNEDGYLIFQFPAAEDLWDKYKEVSTKC